MNTFKKVFLALMVVLASLCVACGLGGVTPEQALASIKLEGTKDVVADFTLPTEVEGFKGTITWVSDYEQVVKIEGNVAKVTRPEYTNGTPIGVTLIATAEAHGVTVSKEFPITVKQLEQSLASLYVKNFVVSTLPTAAAQENFTVPVSDTYEGKDVTITWASSNEAIKIDAQGNAVVTRPNADSANVDVVLTATITIDGKSAVKEFNVSVAKEAKIWDDFKAMFTHYADKVGDGSDDIDYLGVTGWILSDYQKSAMTQTSFTITDGKGYVIYVYAKLEEGYNIGDKVTVFGKFISYYYMPELKEVTLEKIEGQEKTVAELTANVKTLSVADAQAILKAETYKTQLADHGQLVKVEGVLKDSTSQSGYCEIVDANDSSKVLYVYKYMVYEDMKNAYGNVKSVVLYVHDYYSSINGTRFGAIGGTLGDVQLTDAQKVDVVKNGIAALDGTEVVADVKLPSMEGVTVTWTSSHPEVLGVDGKVTLPTANTEVTLTATIVCGDVNETATAKVTVKALSTTQIKDVLTGELGGTYKVSGVVVNVIYNGYYVNDGTGNLLVYKPIDYPKLGETVEVIGSTSEYKNCIQFGNSILTVDKNTAVKTAEELATLVNATSTTIADLLAGKYDKTNVGTAHKVSGTLKVDGYNYYLNDGETQLTVKYVNDAHKEEITSLDKKEVTLVVFVYNTNEAPANFTYCAGTAVERELTDAQKMEKAEAEAKALGTNYSGAGNVELPATLYGVAVSWATSNADVMTEKGIVGSVEADTEVTLTATLTLEGQETKTVDVKFTVKPLEVSTLNEVYNTVKSTKTETIVKFVAKVLGISGTGEKATPVFADATGALNSYAYLSAYKIDGLKAGDVVEVEAVVRLNYAEVQVSKVLKAKLVETEVTPIEPTKLASSNFTSLSGKTTDDVLATSFHNKLIKVVGTVIQSGDYYNVAVNGVNLSLKGIDTAAVSALLGKEVQVIGLIADANTKNGFWEVFMYGAEGELVEYTAPEGGEETPGEVVSYVAKYTGTTTTNMAADANNAESLGLDATLFTVTAEKCGQNNNVGLNKNGTIRLYSDKNANGNALTISCTQTIVSIEIEFDSTVGAFSVNGVAGDKTVSLYEVNGNSVVIKNIQTGDSTQVHIKSIKINVQ